eukprot:10722450-Alexandrium_andersonii.AAC.1
MGMAWGAPASPKARPAQAPTNRQARPPRAAASNAPRAGAAPLQAPRRGCCRSGYLQQRSSKGAEPR